MARAAPTGHRIRRRRRELGLTQAAVARTVGISATYLNLIEHNRRSIGGALLGRLAGALSIRPADLADSGALRLLEDLTEMAADPVFAATPVDGEELRGLLGTAHGSAAAMLALYRAYGAAKEQVEVLSERVSHDPVLAESSHAILSHITAIRASAEILRDFRDLDAQRQRRFAASIATESERLSDAATALFAFLDQAGGRRAASSPAEELDNLLHGADNHFAELEAEAARIGPQHKAIGSLLTPGTPAARFAAAREVARAEAADAIEAELARAVLTTEEARDRARAALERYVAAALLMPYEPFREATRALRYDVDLLGERFSASWEQVCHRLTTLRRPGAEGIPFQFLRTDIAGNISKRFSVSGLHLPRYGGVCPRWVVHQAFLAPDRVAIQHAQLEDGSRYLFVARALTKGTGGYGTPRSVYSVMIGCDAAYASDLVYGDAPGPLVPVGLSCRRCTRQGCGQRAFPPSVPVDQGPQ
ncbi:MAG: helix-turn-helix domain-containing protein [Candidatus Eiseniibacteriota bacterium]